MLKWVLVLVGALSLSLFAANNEEMTSRFILKSDVAISTFSNISLPSQWWSRPYEYAWAGQFVGEGCTVLDAACGISHPFKWYLGQTCKEAWGCDWDSRISNVRQILENVREDLGEEAFKLLTAHPSLYEKVKLVECSITCLPDTMPQFDRIFCLSTLEHMSPHERLKALKAFKDHLTPEGLVILTVDYPVVPPTKLLQDAKTVGLVPAGDVIHEVPPANALYKEADPLITPIPLYVYRTVLKHG